MSVLRFGLLAGVCATSLAAPCAQAQTGPGGSTQTQPEASSDASAVQQIVVTARKREERLEDVPAAVTYFDSAYLEALDVESGKDLTRITPGLYVIDNGSGFNDEFLIRGEGAARQNNAETGAGLYRNGMFIPGGNVGGRNFVPIDFFDVGGVTVLRGPQGSFYGRNALGGAVDIVSQRPGDRVGGEAEFSYGTNANSAGEVVVNVPLSDQFLVRAGAFATQQSDGFYTSSITGAVLDKEESSGARFQLNWRPTSTFDANILIERSDEFGPNVIAFGQVLALNDPPINPTGAPSGFSIPRFSKPVDTPSYFDRSTQTRLLEWSWDLGFATLQSTTGQRIRFARSLSDIDAFGTTKTARLVPTVGGGSESFERTTQDLRLVSGTPGVFSWVIGAEYNKVDSIFYNARFADGLRNDAFDGNADVPTTLPAGCLVAPTCTLTAIQTQARNAYRVEDSGVDDTSYAGYAALTWRPVEALQISADIRVSKDEKNFRLANVFRLDNPATPANEQLTRSITAAETFGKPTPSVSFNWRYAETAVIFGRIGTGYRAGGFNNDIGEIGDGVSAIAVPLSYGEEFVVAYELGTRGRIARSWRYDLSAFLNRKQDTLVNYSVFVGTAPTNTVRNVGVLASAGDSYQYGVDAELVGRFSFAGGTLSPRVSLSWADGQYDGGSVYANTQANPSGTLGLVSIDGKKLQRLRQWTTAASLIYRRPVFGDFDLVAMASQRGEFGGYEDPANTNLMDDVSLYDASLGLDNGRWRLVVSGKNVTNERYFNISPGNLSFNAQQNEPRTVRATLGLKF
jgi:iron complex outermembrane receptor protein